MKLIDDVGFDASFSFIYSPRPGTRRWNWRRHAAAEVKSARLMPAAEAHRRTGPGRQPVDGRHRPARAGRRHLEEGCQRTGRAHRQQPDRQFRGNPRLINTFVDVRITEALPPHSLRGEIVIREKPENPPEATEAGRSAPRPGRQPLLANLCGAR